MHQLSLHPVNKLLMTMPYMPEEPGDLAGALRHIVRQAQTAFAADACTIFALHPISGHYLSSLTLEHNHFKEDIAHGERPKRNGLTRQVLRQGEIFVENVLEEPRYQGNFTRTHHIRSFAALALRTRRQHKPLGVLYISAKQKQTYDDDERMNLRWFAIFVSSILQETWQQRHYQAIAEVGQDINLAFDTIDILFQKLRTRLPDILDISHCLQLAVHDLPTKTLDVYRAEHGCFTQETKPVDGIYQHVIETKEAVSIQHLRRRTTQPVVSLINISETGKGEALIFLPLKFRDVVLGVLSVQHPRPYAYSQEDLFILQLLANHIALAVHNNRLYNSLQQMNEAGRLLTQQLDSEQVLQTTTEKILEATAADVVVLYPYDGADRQSRIPPRVAGRLLYQHSASFMFMKRPNDIATLLLQRDVPIFAKEGTQIYLELDGSVEDLPERFAGREQISSVAGLPLWVKDEVVGVLFVNFRQSQRFDSQQKILIEGLAHFAAIAIKNAQVLGTISRRHLQEVEILRMVDRELSRALDLKQTLRIILTLTNELLQADKASVLLHDVHHQVLRAEVHIGPAVIGRAPVPVSLAQTSSTTATGITRWALEQRRPACVRNIRHDQPWCDLYIASTAGMVAELDVPLIDDGEVVGVFNFESACEGKFLPEDQNFLETLAGQVVIAIKNAQAYEREKRLADEGQTLNDISKEIVSQLNHVRIFDLIVEKALLLTGSTNGVLMLHDPQMNELYVVAEQGMPHAQNWRWVRMDQGLVGYTARTKMVLNVDPTQHPWKEIYLEFVSGARSELVVPMLANEGILRGVINLESPIPEKFSHRDEYLLKGLADLAVIALQNAELYEKAEKEANRFSLLYTAGKDLSRISGKDQIEHAYDIILNLAERQSESMVVIRRINEAQELVVEQASQNQVYSVFPRISIAGSTSGMALSERRTIVIDDTRNPPLGIASELPLTSAVCSMVITPIQFDNRHYGTLSFFNEATGYFRDVDLPFFEGLAQQLASTIYRIETVQERQESKQRAFEVEVMSTMGQSTYELTHRLGNSLGLVESYVDSIQVELGKLSLSSDVITRKLEEIVTSVRSVLKISGELKKGMARLEKSERILEQWVPIAPQHLLENALKQVSVPSWIILTLQVEADVAPVTVIPDLVIDILHNLIDNAIEVMGDGGSLTLRAYNGGRYVVLEVADTGPGISEPLRSKIFDLFFSSKGSSGFGLWSARRNALRNRSELLVESQPGQGTTFQLRLPGTGSLEQIENTEVTIPFSRDLYEQCERKTQ